MSSNLNPFIHQPCNTLRNSRVVTFQQVSERVPDTAVAQTTVVARPCTSGSAMHRQSTTAGCFRL